MNSVDNKYYSVIFCIPENLIRKSRMNSRIRNKKIYQQLYKLIKLVNSSDRWKCFYCGQEASTLDHQPPISKIESFVTSSWGFECALLPCCSSCNFILSDFSSTTISERFLELKNRLRKKYADQLKIAGTWSIDEILELGPTLRRMVLGGVELGLDAENRILYPGHKVEDTLSLWNYGCMKICGQCGSVYDNEECPECGWIEGE